jgi:hypothetical protein
MTGVVSSYQNVINNSFTTTTNNNDKNTNKNNNNNNIDICKLINERRAGGMRIGRGNQSAHAKSVPVSLSSTRPSTDLTWD